MQLVILSNKDCFRIRKGFYQRHAFLQSQDKSGGAQRIALHGGGGQDGNAQQPVFHRIPGEGIQKMVVAFAVLFKIPFINARCV